MTDIDLLPSQSDLLRKVQRGIIDGPAFIIVNGEQGAGKTELARVLADGKVDAHGTWNTVLFEAKRQSRAADVRRAVINSLCGAAVFDPNDSLSDTAKIFGCNKKNCAVIVDSIDYFDRNFLNELYEFWSEYGDQINMSVVVTTSHLLRNLIKPKDGSQAKFTEVTFTRLTEGEKRQLITKTALRLYGEQSVPKGSALDAIVKETPAIPSGIVSYMEKHDPSDAEAAKPAEAESGKKNEAESVSSKKESDPANSSEPEMAKPQVMHRTKAPTGPNKAIVIAAACVLSLALAGVIAMLLMQDKGVQTPNPEEVVAATTIRSGDNSEDAAKIADAGQNRLPTQPTDEILIDQGSLDDALNGANPGEDGEENIAANLQGDAEAPAVQDQNQKVDAQNADASAKADEGSSEENIEAKIKSDAENAASDVIAAVDASSDAAENDAKSADQSSIDKASADAKAEAEMKAKAEAAKTAQKAEDAKAKADAAKSQADAAAAEKEAAKQKAEADAKAKAEAAKQKAEADAKAKAAAAKQKAEADAKAKADAAQKKADAAKHAQKKEPAPKVGEVKPLALAAGTANSGAFVVQIACDSNKSTLEAMIAARKLGPSAYIYERNHKLKYVLVVGGYSSRSEADAAAKHFGQGAWVKSAATVKKESK